MAGNTTRISPSPVFGYIEDVAARYARNPTPFMFSGWNQIRIAIYPAIVSSGSDFTGEFSMGLCSGTSNIPGDLTPTNAVGIWASGNWLRYVGAGAAGAMYNNIFYPYKNVGGVATTGTAVSANTGIMNNEHSGGPGSAFFVDIFKGSPNYSIRIFAAQLTTVFNISEANTKVQSLVTTPSNTSFIYAPAQTIAFDESAGTLDSAYFYWGKAANFMYNMFWRVIKIA